MHDEPPVGRRVDVKFDSIGAEVNGCFKRGNRVFRFVCRRAAVGYDQQLILHRPVLDPIPVLH